MSFGGNELNNKDKEKMSGLKKILIVSIIAIALSSVTINFIWAELYKCQAGLREITKEIMLEIEKPDLLSSLEQKYYEGKIVDLLQECPNDTITLNWENTICDMQGCYEGERKTTKCSKDGCVVISRGE